MDRQTDRPTDVMAYRDGVTAKNNVAYINRFKSTSLD